MPTDPILGKKHPAVFSWRATKFDSRYFPSKDLLNTLFPQVWLKRKRGFLRIELAKEVSSQTPDHFFNREIAFRASISKVAYLKSPSKFNSQIAEATF